MLGTLNSKQNMYDMYLLFGYWRKKILDLFFFVKQQYLSKCFFEGGGNLCNNSNISQHELIEGNKTVLIKIKRVAVIYEFAPAVSVRLRCEIECISFLKCSYLFIEEQKNLRQWEGGRLNLDIRNLISIIFILELFQFHITKKELLQERIMYH